VELTLLLLVIYVPFFQSVFKTAPVPATLWLLILIWPPILLGAEELRKLLVQRTRPVSSIT